MTPRVAVVHPYLLPGGGSEACAMWTVQALQDDCRVTLVSMGRPDLQKLNESCGTSVDLSKIELRSLAIPPGMRTRFDALRAGRVARYCRCHARAFDVMISTYNIMDFSVPGIQWIADFSFDDDLRRELDAKSGAAAGRLYGPSRARSIYLGLARGFAGQKGDGWKRNRTLANSEWTRRLLEEKFGVASEVIYPPVAVEASRIAWGEREDGFVVMGRLVPEKGIGLVIDILTEVRKVRPMHLHILGRRSRAGYAREIEALCRKNRDWVHLEGEVYGPEKQKLLAGHKYGLSGCYQEAFGIAVAEMVKSGAIVWVPDGGGQTEIVADAGLIYSDRDDAVARILAVVGDPVRESDLRGRLDGRASVFSSARSVSAMRAVVHDFLKEGKGRGE